MRKLGASPIIETKIVKVEQFRILCRCGYSWWSESEKRRIACPECHTTLTVGPRVVGNLPKNAIELTCGKCGHKWKGSPVKKWNECPTGCGGRPK